MKHTYSLEFEMFWGVVREHGKKNGVIAGCKSETYKRWNEVVPKYVDNEVLCRTYPLYVRWCAGQTDGLGRPNPRPIVDAERFISKGWYEQFDHEGSDETGPKAPPVAAQSAVGGDLAETWQRVSEALEAADRPSYKSWIAPLRLVGVDERDRPVLQAPSPFKARWVRDHGYQQRIESAFGREVVVR